ncbi:uncharacterized protein ACWYII_022567 [Salvelinus alpinus]
MDPRQGDASIMHDDVYGALQKVVRSAQCITGSTLPPLQDTYSTRCHRKAKKIIEDINHLSHGLFTPLSSRRRVHVLLLWRSPHLPERGEFRGAPTSQKVLDYFIILVKLTHSLSKS